MIQRVTSINASKVKRIPLLRYLPKRVLEYVLDQTHVEHLNADSLIASQGENSPEIRYLVEGEASIRGDAGQMTLCDAESDCSMQPINEENPAPANVVAETAVDLLCLPRELYDAIRALPPVANKRTNQPIELMDANGPEAALYWEFHEAIKNDELKLPSLPTIATRIAKVVNDPNTDNKDIAKVVQADATVAARIISVVNSAAYRGASPIDNLPDAISRLGRGVTHNLVISFALGQLFHHRSPVLKQYMVKLWQHGSYVAAICHELARVTPRLEPAQALLCGLLHDIGSLAIIGAARGKAELTDNPELLDRVIENLKAEVGAMVLRKWDFPDYFVQCALHAEDWLEDISHSPDYVDLLVVAQLHSFIGSSKMSQLPRLDLVPAFHKLALGKLTPRHSIGLLENAKDQIREMKEMLSLSSG